MHAVAYSSPPADGGLTPALATSPLRAAIRALTRTPEPDLLPTLLAQARQDDAAALRTQELALRLARGVRERAREGGRAGLVQGLLQEFALSSQEGVALMCLAEALLRIPDVAAAVGLSGRHFERLFKRETGQSPLRYYHHLRLSKARQRVLYTNDSMREIASSVGYLTSSPMIRHYTEIFGVSPRDERRLTLALRQARNQPTKVQAAE